MSQKSILNPCLMFTNTAREAMEFYHSVLGGTLELRTYGEIGGSTDPSTMNNIMHSQLETPQGFTLMAADGLDAPATGVSVSLSGDNETELRGFFDGLSAGATVEFPLSQAPWGDTFGMFTDTFGVKWLVNISAEKTA